MADLSAPSLLRQYEVPDSFATGARVGGAIGNIVGGVAGAFKSSSNQDKVQELIRLYNGREVDRTAQVSKIHGDLETAKGMLKDMLMKNAAEKETTAAPVAPVAPPSLSIYDVPDGGKFKSQGPTNTLYTP
jgi:hypothetical protein